MAEQKVIDNLLHTYTKNYKLQGPYSTNGQHSIYLNPHRPIFQRMWIPMMMNDPHIWYGIQLLNGPIISKAKYIVESDDPEVQEYVDRQLQTFWNRGILKAIDCLIWGYSGNEVIYRFNDTTQTVDFKDLKYLHPRDVHAVTKDGALVGVEIDNMKGHHGKKYLSRKKVLWTVHDKKAHRWYGRSRLQGAFDSWWEIWQPKGYRGIRHLWFYKNAFSGGVLYYPDGTTQDPEMNEEVPNALIAQEILDRKETGASIALPNKTGDNRDWEYEDAKGNAIPEGLLDYGDVLRDELWEGLGVPPEVAKSEGTGAFAGRRVPQQAFYSYLQEIANELAYDFEEQVLRGVLIPLTFGCQVDFKITPVPILQTLQEEEMGLVTGTVPNSGEVQPGMGGEEEPQFDEEGNPIEEEPEVDENGNPIEEDPQDQNNPFGNSKKPNNGKIEDRKTNAFNLSEKAQKNQKKKKGFK